ncbi:MAG TPA: response regulator transcription factor [Actinomycetota bacterium]|nr:response regulator transcription factor [Actinomycetota bacterium]
MDEVLGRVLAVDDDPHLLRAVAGGLEARGYEVLTAATGEDALEQLSTETVDLVLVDLGLPGISGHEVITRLRSWSDVPVIILSVRDSQDDKVLALDSGADDYLTKPFEIGELLARMRAVKRRVAVERTSPILRFDNLEFDLGKQLVKLDGEGLHLTPTEYKLLEAMATRPGKLLTHGWLLQKVWGPSYGTESHYLRLYVRQIRKKLGDDAAFPKWITTEPGLGYRWLPEPARDDGDASTT